MKNTIMKVLFKINLEEMFFLLVEKINLLECLFDIGFSLNT